MNGILRPVCRVACLAALAFMALHSGPLPAQAWQRQQQIQQQQQQQRQMDMQRQQEMQRQQMQEQQRRAMQEQQRRAMQEQQRRTMQEQQRDSMRQQSIAQQRALMQQGARTAIANNKQTGLAGTGANARLVRPLTPGEIQRGFTGRVTADGRALIKFQNRVVVVPASRVSGLSAKLAAQKRTQAEGAGQKVAGLRASMVAVLAQSAGERSLRGGGSGGSGSGGRRVAANDNSMSANRIAYSGFVKESGHDPAGLFPHSRGWDFSKPMRVTTIKAGTELCQWMVPDKPGAYYAACGTPPSRLGISPHGVNSANEVIPKISKRYVATRDLQALEGTAANVVDDWSVKGERTPAEGGARQYLVRRADLDFMQEQE